MTISRPLNPVSPGPRARASRNAILRVARILGSLALLFTGPLASPVRATECDPFGYDLSTVPRAIPMAPDGSLAYTVRIVCIDGPRQNSHVNLLFTDVGDSLVCWCNTSPWVPGTPHSFFADTDVNGYATFHLFAGGCVERYLAAIPGDRNFAAEVFADFVKMNECGVVSPDAVDHAGRLSTSTPAWDPAGGCATGLSDAVLHTTALAASSYSWCTDINGDRVVSLSDGVILTPYLAAATTCSGNAGY